MLRSKAAKTSFHFADETPVMTKTIENTIFGLCEPELL